VGLQGCRGDRLRVEGWCWGSLGWGADPPIPPVKLVLPGAPPPASLPTHGGRAALPVQALPQLGERGGRGRGPFTPPAAPLPQPQVRRPLTPDL
jgi:hypothetical protein